MNAVINDRVGMEADGKNLAQLVDTCFDNWLAVLEGFAGIAVDPAKPGPAHALRDAVVGRQLSQVQTGCCADKSWRQWWLRARCRRRLSLA